VNSTDRIVVGDAERTEFGHWYARLRPGAWWLLLVCSPLLVGYQIMIIRRVVGGSLSRSHSPVIDTFRYVVMTAFCVWMMYILIRQAARRQLLYVGDDTPRIRSKIFQFQFDERLVALDRIRTLDYGGKGNLELVCGAPMRNRLRWLLPNVSSSLPECRFQPDSNRTPVVRIQIRSRPRGLAPLSLISTATSDPTARRGQWCLSPHISISPILHMTMVI
jgi:hypothetical protein